MEGTIVPDFREDNLYVPEDTGTVSSCLTNSTNRTLYRRETFSLNKIIGVLTLDHVKYDSGIIRILSHILIDSILWK